MTTIKAKFRASSVEGKMGVIYYEVVHRNVVRQFTSEYALYAHEWCRAGVCVEMDNPQSERGYQLQLINDKVQFEIRRLYGLAKSMSERGCMNHADDLVYEYRRQPKMQTLFGFFRSQISRLEEFGRHGTALNYVAAFNSFRLFRTNRDMVFDRLTAEVVEEYEAFLKRRNLSMNSSSFYLRILRAVYNRAVEAGLAQLQNPFKRVYTGVEKTMKRALPLADLKRIKECDLSYKPAFEYSRDMFLFSFYTRGMSFIDMAHLRKSDLRNGILSYRRRKTGQLLHIKWERCMQDIVDRYSAQDSIYMLPILDTQLDKQGSSYNQYKNEQAKVNNCLKLLSAEIKLSIPLTMYVARHSWASTARTKNIPLSVISEGMGHDSETTTQIYLASLDTSIIDRANCAIINSL